MINKRFYGDVEEYFFLDYCVNCSDVRTGIRGTFAYDADLFSNGGGLVSISPVFGDVMSFYLWAKRKGFRYHSLDKMFTLSREFC